MRAHRHVRALTAVLVAALATAIALTGCSRTSDSADVNAADVAFATDMIPHHRQAVSMAELAPSRASDPEVKRLASAIQQAQDPEIATMSRWLRAWGEDVPADETGADMSGEMAGMLSPEDLAGLADARGAAFDREFLTLMKAHHEGAVEMARREQSDGRYPQAVRLARRIEADQTKEIATISSLLDGR